VDTLARRGSLSPQHDDKSNAVDVGVAWDSFYCHLFLKVAASIYNESANFHSALNYDKIEPQNPRDEVMSDEKEKAEPPPESSGRACYTRSPCINQNTSPPSCVEPGGGRVCRSTTSNTR
jgi:hypothetical protein